MINTTYKYYNRHSANPFVTLKVYSPPVAASSIKVVKVIEDVIKDESVGVYSVTERDGTRVIWTLETSDSIRHPFATYEAALDWALENVGNDLVMEGDDANSSNPEGLRSFRNRRRYYQPVVTIREELLMG